MKTSTKLKSVYRKYRRPIRGFLGWFFGLVIQVTAPGAGEVMNWDAKRWAFTLGIAALPGFVGLIGAGDPNPTDEELYEKVHAVKQKRIEAKLEVTDPNGFPLKKPEA